MRRDAYVIAGRDRRQPSSGTAMERPMKIVVADPNLVLHLNLQRLPPASLCK